MLHFIIDNGNDPMLLLHGAKPFRGQLKREFHGSHFKAAFSLGQLLPVKRFVRVLVSVIAFHVNKNVMS
jgi:hypothetical protein